MQILTNRIAFTGVEKQGVIDAIFGNTEGWQSFFFSCTSPTLRHELNRASLRFAKGHLIETYVASIVGGCLLYTSPSPRDS